MVQHIPVWRGGSPSLTPSTVRKTLVHRIIIRTLLSLSSLVKPLNTSFAYQKSEIVGTHNGGWGKNWQKTLAKHDRGKCSEKEYITIPFSKCSQSVCNSWFVSSSNRLPSKKAKSLAPTCTYVQHTFLMGHTANFILVPGDEAKKVAHFNCVCVKEVPVYMYV